MIESTIAFLAMAFLATILLRAASNATAAQRWTVISGMTDAFMTRELAIAKRIPFEDFKDAGSDWPIYPAIATENVVVGKLVGGRDLTATVQRTRRPSTNNHPDAGGTGNDTTNPIEMEAWKLQSYLTYSVADIEYVKSRTTLRVR